MAKILKKIGYGLLFAFAVCVSIITIPLLFIFKRAAYDDLALASAQDHLSDRTQQHRLQHKMAHTTPVLATHKEIKDEINNLVVERNWIAIADRLQDLDQSRARCPGNKSLSLIALTAFTDHPDTLNDSGVREQLEALWPIYPKRYGLTAMAAMHRLNSAWMERGNGFANSIPKYAFELIDQHVSKAEWLLSRDDAATRNAPLLAAVTFRLLPFLDDADKKLIPFYEAWSALDPICQEPHREVGFKLLPRWYGDLPQLERVARQAAIRTRAETGASAYFVMLSQSDGCGDPLHLVIDTDLFAEGARDLLKLRGNDPALAAIIAQEVQELSTIKVPHNATPQQKQTWQDVNAALELLFCEILANNITAIHPPSWGGDKLFLLDTISDVFRKEMDEGCHFRMDENGITVLPAPVEPEVVAA